MGSRQKMKWLKAWLGSLRLPVAVWLAVGCMALTAAVSAAPFEGSFDWSTAEEIYPGIRHAALTFTGPRPLKVNAVEIDLTNPDFRFHTTPRDEDWGKPMPDFPSKTIRTRRQTTRKYIAQARQAPEQGGYGIPVVLAINAAPWTPWESPFNHRYADTMGLAVSDGVVVCETNGSFPSFIVNKDRSVDIRLVAPGDDLSDIQMAVSGFGIILEDGEVYGDDSYHPRTIFGLSGDKSKLYLMTVDGRQKGYSEGINTGEGALLMKFFGAEDAINMDGGGSTTMWVESLGVVNHPTDNRKFDHAGERRVYDILYVRLKSAAELPLEPSAEEAPDSLDQTDPDNEAFTAAA